ncbi:MAG: glycoside hydrolase family 2 TIM barrel-domain containing protein [Planctomycetota bacterium]
MADTQAVWLEAETPTDANFALKTTSGGKGEVLSGGLWVSHSEAKDAMPEGGWRLSYQFETTTAGRHSLWARIGYEGARAPMEWRVDGGPWHTLSPDAQTTNVMELAVWYMVAWAPCGEVELPPGRHTLALRFQQPGAKDRFLFALDCLAIVRGAFVPEGKLKPGETYRGQIDVDAATKVYRFPADAPAAPQRCELPLDGLWQVARYDDPDMDTNTWEPIRAIPAGDEYPLRWMGAEVPGDLWKSRAEMTCAHRLFLQTRVFVPAEMRGRSFVLHFAGTSFIASVFCNGKYVDGRQSVLVPWDADLTNCIEPGKENVITVGIKSGVYAVDLGRRADRPGGLDSFRYLPEKNYRSTMFLAPVYPSSKGEGNGMQTGIVYPARLIVAGPAYTSDAFVRTSVAPKRLDADIEVTNPSPAPVEVEVRCEAVHDKTGEVEKSFPVTRIAVPAGGSAVAKLGGPWENPKLWWPSESVDDLPDCYRLRTTLMVDGREADVREDLFGFRELGIDGKHFLLNGLRWHYYNWINVPESKTVQHPSEWFRLYHEQNDGFHRFSSDHTRRFGSREQAVEFLDRMGIPSRASTCIDGMFSFKPPTNPLVWQNFELHLRQAVKEYRNHPSLVHWSIGNEYMLINVRNRYYKEYERWEHEMARLGKVVESLDPTRPWYEDGAGDLGGLGPVNCQHYMWSEYENYPADLYRYPTGPAALPRGEATKERSVLYRWDGARPLVGGEEFFYARADQLAWFGGPEVFRSKVHADDAAGRYARMAIEGARWQEAGGMCPWSRCPTPDAAKCMARRAVFVREHNSCFYPGAVVTRTLGVFNDTRRTDPLVLRWKVVLGDQEIAGGEKTYRLEPGHRQIETIAFTMPAADRRVDGQLQLQLQVDGKRVFEDSKPLSVVPSPAAGSLLAQRALCVFDPRGKVEKWLSSRGQPFTRMSELGAIPEGARVVLVGRDAIDAAAKRTAVPKLVEFAAGGGIVVVLEHVQPLEETEIPVAGLRLAPESADKAKTYGEFSRQGGRTGAICHPAARAHRVLRGVEPGDLFTWAGGETNFRMSHILPPGGALGIVVAGDNAALAPILEAPVGNGSFLLSQMVLEEKLGVEPTAEVLLQNILDWARERMEFQPVRATVFSGGDEVFETQLAGLGLDAVLVSSVEEALEGPSVERGVCVVRLSPETARALAARASEVQRYCQGGGWILLAGGDVEAVKALAPVTGVDVSVRPFRTEKVAIERRDDPWLMGLSDREFTQSGYEMIHSGRKLYILSDDVFGAVLDLGVNAAPFSRRAPGVVSDGLLTEDYWRYTLALPSDGSQPVEMEWDEPQTISEIRLGQQLTYDVIEEIEVRFDDGPPQKYAMEAHNEMQSFRFEPRAVRKLSVTITKSRPTDRKPVAIFQEIEVVRTAPPADAAKAVALCWPAGLVKFPIGRGGILLNTMPLSEAAPAGEAKTSKSAAAEAGIRKANAEKKARVYATLLKNMGAAFKPAELAAPEPPSKPKRGAKPRRQKDGPESAETAQRVGS